LKSKQLVPGGFPEPPPLWMRGIGTLFQFLQLWQQDLAIAMPTSPTRYLLQLTRRVASLLYNVPVYGWTAVILCNWSVMNIPTYKHTNTTWLHCTI